MDTLSLNPTVIIIGRISICRSELYSSEHCKQASITEVSCHPLQEIQAVEVCIKSISSSTPQEEQFTDNPIKVKLT